MLVCYLALQLNLAVIVRLCPRKPYLSTLSFLHLPFFRLRHAPCSSAPSHESPMISLIKMKCKNNSYYIQLFLPKLLAYLVKLSFPLCYFERCIRGVFIHPFFSLTLLNTHGILACYTTWNWYLDLSCLKYNFRWGEYFCEASRDLTYLLKASTKICSLLRTMDRSVQWSFRL